MLGFSRFGALPRRRAIAALFILSLFILVFLPWYNLYLPTHGTVVKIGPAQPGDSTLPIPSATEHTDDGNKGRPPKYAFVTFVAEDTTSAGGKKKTGESVQQEPENDSSDMYYQAARVLGYKIMHDEHTKTIMGIPFVTIVTDAVSERKRTRLQRDGAIVVPVENVKVPAWIKSTEVRWKDQFTKLRLFELVEYDLVLYIDADTLLLRPLDGVFTDPVAIRGPRLSMRESRKSEIKQDEAPIPDQYFFAARPDNFNRSHPYPPPLHGRYFNGGFWLAKPSLELFNYYHSVMQHPARFDTHYMEQSLLNYAHREVGPMPWSPLGTTWNANWPGDQDLEGGCASLHDKFWQDAPAKMQKLWREDKEKMEKFYKNKDQNGT